MNRFRTTIYSTFLNGLVCLAFAAFSLFQSINVLVKLSMTDYEVVESDVGVFDPMNGPIEEERELKGTDLFGHTPLSNPVAVLPTSILHRTFYPIQALKDAQTDPTSPPPKA